MGRSVSVSSLLFTLLMAANAVWAEPVVLRADRMLDVDSGRILSNATVVVDRQTRVVIPQIVQNGEITHTVAATGDGTSFDLELEVPIEWFPRLRDATPEQRRDLRLVGGGIGIHWPQLDEDLSVRGLLFPHPEDAQRVS